MPFSPVRDMIFAPNFFEVFIPSKIFFDSPLVEIAIITSPFFTNDSACLENIFSKL